jgi:hypothetical protein
MIEIMKAIIIIIALIFSLNVQTQNVNIKETTQTTVTTVKNSQGDKKYTKKENVREVENIELKQAKPHTINVEMKDSPTRSTTTTNITNSDGTNASFNVKQSSYYMINGNKYTLNQDGSGYVLTSGNMRSALLRKTSTGSYVFVSKTKTAIGHFDVNGNLIIETYDNKSDKIITETYLITKD